MEIWSQGYACTGNSSGAFLLFKDESSTFEQTIENYNKQDFRDKITYNNGNYSCWGCRLFDNQKEADESF